MKEQSAIGRSAAKSPARLWLALVLGTLSAFGPFSLDMYLPALPQLAGELHTTASLTQLSLTACLAGLALGQLLAGPLSDVRGRRTPLLIGLALYAAASLLCVFSPSIWSFVAMRFVQGAAGAVGIVISRAVVRDLFSGAELTKFFASLSLVNGAAPIIAPIAGAQLLHVMDWRGIFFVLAALGLLTLLAVLFGLPETLPVERRMPGGLKQTWLTFRHIAGDRSFMGYALSQGFVTAAMFAYIAGSPFVLQQIYGASPQMFSVCFAINGAGIIIASQVTGRLAGKLGETRLLVGGLAMAACGGVGLLTAILADAGLYGVLIPLFFVVSSVGAVSTASFSLAMRNQAKSAGSASALLGVMTFLFGGAVAPLVGLGGEDTAVPMGLVIAAGDVGALLLFFVLNGRKKSTSRPAKHT
ncbi:multidrug effflux MFS transporter [Paenibacillus hemerocallicola]|uniref:Bcr/CflA family efflux transporter n=1 Tax=Paenibacillus hemerocallicola TaxID=1172614 RepID=A0A5C4T9P5_9BACL|nr:multidrug effflux MFS transporter [Paenibacillus hemerocallicola]TNJ65137.1 multidrug effflux MFS transporter [Paenibacillus hemerocallicola]